MTASFAPPTNCESSGGASSVLHVGVEKHFGAKLCVKNDLRVQDTLCASSSRFPSISRFLHSNKRSGKSGGDRQGNRFHVGEGRDRGNPSFRRLFLSTLPRPQARWLETNNQPEETKCEIPRDASFPHEHDKGCRRSPSPRRLGGVNRSEGCVFPRADSQRFEEISPLRVETETVPILRSLLRPLSRSPRLHSSHEADSIAPPSPRDSLDLLFRRHPHCGIDKRGVREVCESNPQSPTISRVHNQLSEVVSSPSPIVQVSGANVEHDDGHGEHRRSEAIGDDDEGGGDGFTTSCRVLFSFWSCERGPLGSSPFFGFTADISRET